MFVTIQCLVFDLAKRQVTCAGAGHHQLVILSPGQAAAAGLSLVGPAGRAACRSTRSRASRCRSSPGDTFVLFSDGVSEAMNAADDFFGEERLLALLAALDPRAAGRHRRRASLERRPDFRRRARRSRTTSRFWPHAIADRHERRGKAG